MKWPEVFPSCPFRQMMEQQQQMQAHMERERRSSNSGSLIRVCYTLAAVVYIITYHLSESHTDIGAGTYAKRQDLVSIFSSRFSFPRPPCCSLRGPPSNTSPNEHGWSSSSSTSARTSTTFSRGTPASSPTSTSLGWRESRGWASRPDGSGGDDRWSQTAARSKSETPVHVWGFDVFDESFSSQAGYNRIISTKPDWHTWEVYCLYTSQSNKLLFALHLTSFLSLTTALQAPKTMPTEQVEEAEDWWRRWTLCWREGQRIDHKKPQNHFSVDILLLQLKSFIIKTYN